MPLTNKEETLWVLAIIKNCLFECRSEHGLVPECSFAVGCFYLTCNGFGWLSHYISVFGVKWAFKLLWIASNKWRKLYKNGHFSTNPWPLWKEKHSYCWRATIVLCSALNVIIKEFNFVYNFVLICTFNAHLSEINKTKQVYSYNATLKI